MRVTLWFLAYSSRYGEPRDAIFAVRELCWKFWPAIYCYLRRNGEAINGAAQQTATFLTHLFEGNYLRYVRPEHECFREFLLFSLKQSLAGEWDSASANRSKDSSSAFGLEQYSENQLTRFEPLPHQTPEEALNRRWALIILERAFKRLDLAGEGSAGRELYEALKPHLTSGLNGSARKLTDVCPRSATAINLAVDRLRSLYGSIVRDEVLETLRSGENLEAEIRQLRCTEPFSYADR